MMEILKKNKKKTFIPEEINPDLTEKQQLFCLLYVFDKDCFCNGTMSYMRAYLLKDSQRKVAQAASSRMLSNVIIRKYINKLLLDNFKNTVVDAEHSRIILQNKNLIAKLGGIQEYNKIKKRVDEAPVGKIEFSWKENRNKDPSNQAKQPKAESKTGNRVSTPKGKFVIEINK